MDTITTGLSKSDIAALRLADDVYAVLYEDEYKLRAIKRPSAAERERNPFADDQRIDIPVEGFVTVYDRNAGSNHAASLGVTACFASLWETSGVWQIVRPGDRIRLRFAANNSTDNIRAVDYVRDSVSIEVIRKADVHGRKPLRFSGSDYVGPNNSARFVRNSNHGLH